MRDISSRLPSLGIPEERPLLRRLPTLAWGLPACAVLLAVIGLTVVRSASTELAVDYLPRQAAWVGVGVAGDGGRVRDQPRHAPAPRGAALRASGSWRWCSCSSSATRRGGARSWIGIGGLGGQPSDLMKLATILLLVRYLGGQRPRSPALRASSWWSPASWRCPAVLIALEPDLGGALILLPALGALVLARRAAPAGGGRGGAGRCVVLGAAGWAFALQDYQRERILHLLLAVDRSAGRRLPDPPGQDRGRLGRAPGQGLPAGHAEPAAVPAGAPHRLRLRGAGRGARLRRRRRRCSRSTSTICGAECGWRAAPATARRSCWWSASSPCSRFTSSTTPRWSIGLVPITGIPLPFLSYGGSFTMWSFFVTGLILGVDFRRWVNR